MNFDVAMTAVLGPGSCIRWTRKSSYVHNFIDIVNKYKIDIYSVQKVSTLLI